MNVCSFLSGAIIPANGKDIIYNYENSERQAVLLNGMSNPALRKKVKKIRGRIYSFSWGSPHTPPQAGEIPERFSVGSNGLLLLYGFICFKKGVEQTDSSS